jgi:hypothetical protein
MRVLLSSRLFTVFAVLTIASIHVRQGAGRTNLHTETWQR